MERKEKREIIIASIIGDGSIYMHARTCRLYIGHSYKQLDYLLWKSKLIQSAGLKSNYIGVQREMKNKKLNKTYSHVSSIWTGKQVELYYKWFRKDGEKTVEHVLKYLYSPRSLAIWFMDDGSVFKRKRKHTDGSIYYLKPSMKLCTHSFNKKDNLLIIKWLKETFDIDGYVVIERKRNRENQPEYFTLAFNVENSKKVWDLIRPFVNQIGSMKEKFSFIESAYNK